MINRRIICNWTQKNSFRAKGADILLLLLWLRFFEFRFNQILWYVVTHFDLKFLDFLDLDGSLFDLALLLIVILRDLFL
jgi:hypothetical protein